MKVVFTIIGVIIVLLMFGVMMGGIKDAQTDTREDTIGAVTTAGGTYEADVVLVAPLYNDDILEIVSITSDNASDTPLQDSYVSASRTLTVRGLVESDTRALTVNYRYGSLTGQAATASTFLNFLPVFIGIALVVIIVAVIIAAFKSRG